MYEAPIDIQAEFETGRRSMPGGLGQIVLLLVFAFSTGALVDFPVLMRLLGAVILVLNLLRFQLGLRQSHYYPSHRKRWNRLLGFTIAVPAAAWGVLFAAVLRGHGLSGFPVAIAMLVGSGIAAAMTTSVSPRIQLARLVILLLLGPALLVLLQMMTFQSLAMAVIFFTYLVFLNAQAIIQNRTLWDSLRNRATLQEERDRLQGVLDSIPGLVSWIGNDLRFRGMNSNFEQYFGLHSGTVAGKTVESVLDDGFSSAVQEFMRSGREHEAREILLRTNEQQRWHLLVMRKKALRAAGGMDEEAYLIFIDIQDLKTAEAELERRRIESELTAKLAAVGEFTAGIAHEVKNPLTVTLNSAALLRRALDAPGGFKPESIRNMVDKISRSSERMEKIVGGLTRFSRDSEREPPSMVSLEQVVLDSLELIGSQFNANRVRMLSVAIPSDMHVFGRATELSQVLINLLSNAIDAAKEGDEHWVRLEANFSLEDWLEVKVTDSGKGITPSQRNHLFEPFFTTKPVGKGTGLGLSISKRIVERYGGALYLDPSASRTTFVIRLPRAQPGEKGRVA